MGTEPRLAIYTSVTPDKKIGRSGPALPVTAENPLTARRKIEELGVLEQKRASPEWGKEEKESGTDNLLNYLPALLNI